MLRNPQTADLDFEDVIINPMRRQFHRSRAANKHAHWLITMMIGRRDSAVLDLMR